MRSNTASICPVTETSSGMRIGASICCASGSTYDLAFSFR
jgi:hypothetical protein